LDVRWVSKESALLVFFSPGSGLSSHSVLQGQTTRQFSTTIGRGSYTCSTVFSSPTERGTLCHGCGSTASQTRTRWVTTARLCSVGFPLLSALRGVSAVFTVSLTWWVCVPTPAVDVVATSNCSSRGAGSSRLVPSAKQTSIADMGVPVGPDDSSSRENGADVQRVHG
jgi:hypothetical protein